MAEPARTPLLAPRRVLAGITVIVLIALLFSPTARSIDVPPSLTTLSKEPGGARGLYEVLGRLGFDVQRWVSPMRKGLSDSATYMLLTPPLPLTTSEAHSLLQAVRRGATLMVYPERGTQIADSLGLFSHYLSDAMPIDTSFNSPVLFDLDELRARAHTLRVRGTGPDSSDVYVLPTGARLFATMQTKQGTEPTIVGLSLGRGRVIVYADPGLFRNSRMRDPNRGIRAVRLIEWLVQDNRQRPIWFDEYHHGYGTHADLLRVARRAIFGTPPGRVLLQLCVALLMIYLALGIRPVKPRPLTRIERRSPLEHVGALARAYDAVHAQTLAARLLVRGLRRRQGALRGRLDESAWLHAIRERYPETAPDVDRVLRALDQPAENGQDLTASISRIERGLRT